MNGLLQINFDFMQMLFTLLGVIIRFISAVVNRKEIRRIKRSEAVQSEASAKR